MKTALYGMLVVLLGLFSAFLGDGLMIAWLSAGAIDVTGHYFALGILPVELVAVGITTLLLMKAYKHRPRLYIPMYAVVSLSTHFFWLRFLFNPLPDIAAYLTGLLIAFAICFSLLWRFYLRT